MIVFSIPIVVGELFQNLYNSVDALIVGNCVGKTALAAITSCEMPINLIIGFFNGMSIGASVTAANFFGCKNHDGVFRSIQVNFNFSIVFGLLISAVGFLIAPLLLKVSAVQGEIYTAAVRYLRIYLGGLVFTVIYNMLSGLLRSVGDSKTPFYVLTLTCCVNIGLDIIMVALLNLNIVGAALATVASQALSSALLIIKLKRGYPGFHVDFSLIKEERNIIYQALRIGVPAGLQTSLVAISNLFVWRYVNMFSTDIIAGFGIAFRIDAFVGLPSRSFGLTATTFVAQMVGSGKYERGRKGCIRCLLLAIGIVSSFAGLVFLFAETLVSMFNSDPAVISEGVHALRMMVPFYCIVPIRDIFLGILRGHEDTKVPLVLSLIGMVGLRQIYLSASMSRCFRIENVYIGLPLAWCATSVFLVAYYCSKRKALWKITPRHRS